MKFKLPFLKRSSETPKRSTVPDKKRHEWRPSCQELADGLVVTEVPDLEPEELEGLFALSPASNGPAKPADKKD
jgi:hypothetical protein